MENITAFYNENKKDFGHVFFSKNTNRWRLVRGNTRE